MIRDIKENNKETNFTEIRLSPNNKKNGTAIIPATSDPPE
jgi:hypothetical protein